MNYGIVDSEDSPRVNQYRWSSQGNYLRTGIYSEGKSRNVYLHHFLIGMPVDRSLEVDHKNRNKLDNRKSNLRFVPHAENMRNIGGKCVTYRPLRKRWISQVSVDGKSKYVGSFKTLKEALQASENFKKTAAQRRKK